MTPGWTRAFPLPSVLLVLSFLSCFLFHFFFLRFSFFSSLASPKVALLTCDSLAEERPSFLAAWVFRLDARFPFRCPRLRSAPSGDLAKSTGILRSDIAPDIQRW
jgi:hypothetical protein